LDLVLVSAVGYLRVRFELFLSSAVPRPVGHPDFSGYCRAELFHGVGKQEWQSDHVECEKESDVANIMWDQTFKWDFDEDELAFIRLEVAISGWSHANKPSGSKLFVVTNY
jgi:phosphatidylinositol phospholipase C delta